MNTSEHCKEVYAHCGLALYCAQVLEQAIIHALMFLDLIPKSIGRINSREEWQKLYDHFFGNEQNKTLGQLLKKLKSIGQLPDDLDSILSRALVERNRLAHSYFWENAEKFVNKNGRDKMISELKNSYELFTEAENILSSTMQKVYGKYGFTSDKYKQMESEYIRIKGIEYDL